MTILNDSALKANPCMLKLLKIGMLILKSEFSVTF